MPYFAEKRKMKKQTNIIIVIILLLGLSTFAQKANKSEVILSAIKGTISKTDTIKILEAVKADEINIIGTNASFFKIKLVNKSLIVNFEPATNFTGVAKATLKLRDNTINLTGLSTKGLEGENEAPISEVVEALGYKINLGWNTLANHWRPTLQGEEIEPSLFQKVTDDVVEIIPVARYSPDFLLNFGFYTNSSSGPQQHQVGVLAKAGQFPEHQTLFPALGSGKTYFDPKNKVFGLYAISPSHSLYSEDLWNILFYPTHATHAVRTYPVKDKVGNLVKNTYLVCMEEAVNGDYNDYVFLIKNVKPINLNNDFITLFNGKNFDGWYSWLQGIGKNNDPNKVFTVENGIIHDTGKDLGYLMTENKFKNYHFTVDFKWGDKKWAPRENNKRDSGICYNIPEGTPDHIWPASVECQIQEGDVGDFWLLDNVTIQADGKQNTPSAHTQVVKKKDAERPAGEWNTVEVISFNGKCVHIVNGVVVNYGENASVVGGSILLQSEYAEIFYKNIKIRNL